MTKSVYINCINYYDIFTGSTGSVKGIYDFDAGINNIIYNLIYSTSEHYSGTQIYSPVIPLISVGSRTIANYTFSGINNYQVGYNQSGDFGVLLDMRYSGCSKTTTGIGHVLLSTADSSSGLSGAFLIGINDSNRLFFGTSGDFDQLDYELKNRNLVYISLAGQKHVNYGVFDYLNRSYIGNSLTLTNDQNAINKIYIGGFLCNSDRDYTGFFGKINNAVFFDQHVNIPVIENCCDCLFVTGQVSAASVTNYTVPAITGYVLSGISGQLITGYVIITGNVSNCTGASTKVVFNSGLFGSIQTGQATILLTGMTTVSVTGKNILTFFKNRSIENAFNVFNLEFSPPLASGDILEVYAHNDFNPYVNLQMDGFSYPESTNFVQIIGNGLVETLNVDYAVVRNEVSGFLADDGLAYDLLSGASSVIAYSGFWSRSKIFFPLDLLYFPESSQFGERSGTMVASGLTGAPITNRSNFYLNGQKLISGVHYSIHNDLTFNYYGLSGYVAEFYPSGSGILSDFTADILYDNLGNATGVGDIQDSELTMINVWDNNYNRYFYNITSETVIISNITGFSEQVWINGIRQSIGDNYIKDFPCSLTSGTIDLPNTPLHFLKNENNFFNIG